jgi:tryptophan synthase beta chain
MQNLPDSHGRFGQFGGRFVAETLMPALFELEKAYKLARGDPEGPEDRARFRAKSRVAHSALSLQ